MIEPIDGKSAHHQGGRRDQSPPRLPYYFRSKVDIHEDFLQSMLSASKPQWNWRFLQKKILFQGATWLNHASGELAGTSLRIPAAASTKPTPHIGSTLAWLMPGYLLYLCNYLSVSYINTCNPSRAGRFKSQFVRLHGVDGLELSKPDTDRLALYSGCEVWGGKSRAYLFFVLRFALLSHSWYCKNMSHIRLPPEYTLNFYLVISPQAIDPQWIYNITFSSPDKHKQTSQHLIHWRKWRPLFHLGGYDN